MPLPIKYDGQGLVPAVIQDYLTGEIRMFAFATDRAVRVTLETGFATFWSRSRGELWQRGRASGLETPVVRVLADCDADCIVYSSDPTVPSCNTGARSCFFQAFESDTLTQATEQPQTALTALEADLRSEAGARTEAESSGGPAAHGAAFQSCAKDFASAIEGGSDDRVVAKAAAVLRELLVCLVSRAIPLRRVLGELAVKPRSAVG
jgi:phosphoribosyl-ATP pyrophosphohydrolase/phosphoribosyl-AMP cyclohydrolase